MSASPRRRLLLPEMEGGAARRYARQRGTEGQLAECRREAARLTAGLAEGVRVLEVAPGPGYLSLEMARSGRLNVTGLDISRTMVEIATQKAREQGVVAEFRQGDVSEMPFAGQSFDLVVTQAAFKNFRRPLAALQEMHRVLREGGTAVVQDMSHEATRADIANLLNGETSRLDVGWRSSIAGDPLRSLIAGAVAAAFDEGGTLVLEERSFRPQLTVRSRPDQ